MENQEHSMHEKSERWDPMKQIIMKISEWVFFLFLAWVLFSKGVELISMGMEWLSIYTVVLEWVVGIILVIPAALIIANRLTEMVKKLIAME